MKNPSLVSQSVIDASDKLYADTMAKVNADPKLRKICDDIRKEAQANIDRHKKVQRRRKATVGYPLMKVLYHYEESLLPSLQIVIDYTFRPTCSAPYNVDPRQQYEGWLCPKLTDGEETEARHIYGEHG
jgi:hypothetical protein